MCAPVCVCACVIRVRVRVPLCVCVRDVLCVCVCAFARVCRRLRVDVLRVRVCVEPTGVCVCCVLV